MRSVLIKEQSSARNAIHFRESDSDTRPQGLRTLASLFDARFFDDIICEYLVNMAAEYTFRGAGTPLRYAQSTSHFRISSFACQ